MNHQRNGIAIIYAVFGDHIPGIKPEYWIVFPMILSCKTRLKTAVVGV